MKSETLQILSTAKILFDKAQELCFVDDRYVASSGLIILQDVLELIFYAILIEIGVDEQKTIDSLNFNQLISEIVKAKINVPKIGTLKALNKQRVIVKHYGQLSEPEAVKNYFNVSKYAIDHLLNQVIKKNLEDVLLDEVIKNEEIRTYIKNAREKINNNNFFDSLIEIRKALFLTIEQEYSIEKYKDYDPNNEKRRYYFLTLGGFKAPYYTKNKDWIDNNVKDPFDYIQLDHEKLKIDLMEWGVSTQDFWNLWRLTPEVFQFSDSKEWIVKRQKKFFIEDTSEKNARYCLDRIISLLVKRQNHSDLGRYIKTQEPELFSVKLKIDQHIFDKASEDSEIVISLPKGTECLASSVIAGFDSTKYYYKIIYEDENKQYFSGYIPFDSCE